VAHNHHHLCHAAGVFNGFWRTLFRLHFVTIKLQHKSTCSTITMGCQSILSLANKFSPISNANMTSWNCSILNYFRVRLANVEQRKLLGFALFAVQKFLEIFLLDVCVWLHGRMEKGDLATRSRIFFQETWLTCECSFSCTQRSICRRWATIWSTRRTHTGESNPSMRENFLHE